MNKKKYEDRPINEIKEDLSSLLKMNKMSIHEVKLYLMAISYEIILNTKLFKLNVSLNDFVKNIYVNKLNLEEDYKEYLFNSRTLLASRIQRDIFEKAEYNQILIIIKELILFLDIYNDISENKTKNISSNNNAQYIVEWMKFLKGNEDEK